jgi:hypothetical protein
MKHDEIILIVLRAYNKMKLKFNMGATACLQAVAHVILLEALKTS